MNPNDLTGPQTRGVEFELKDIRLVKADDDSEVGQFEGLASTFGNRDLQGDVIMPGAFKGTNPRKVRMLWQHNAAKPIGVWDEMEETEKGLVVKGHLILGVQQADEAYKLLKGKALDAMSIGFRVPNPKRDVEWDEAEGVRRIKKVELWEVSLVTFPANPKARVARTKAEEIATIREFEAVLRDEHGFSHRQAKLIASGGYPALIEDRDDPAEASELVACLQRATDSMTA